MDNSKIGLLTTLLLGIFILVGALLAFLVKKKQKVVDFSLGLAFGVIIMLLITDLLPEIIEHLGLKYIYIFIIGTIVGFLILKLLDRKIPDHEQEEKSVKANKENLIHIGIITSLALMLHNMIEGMAVYSTILSNTTLGVAVMIGIGFHNIPLGMVIASTFHQSNQNIWKTLLIVLIVSISTFVGGLIMFFLNLTEISPVLLGTLLSLTLGMLIFISFDELLPRIRKTKEKKLTYIGMVLGVVLLLVATII